MANNCCAGVLLLFIQRHYAPSEHEKLSAFAQENFKQRGGHDSKAVTSN
jgi:hypothetical protein